jgi:hypothetical protein
MAEPAMRGPRPIRGWEWIWRSCFGADHRGRRYVEVDFFDLDARIWLYVDGVREDMRKERASWRLDDGSRLVARLQTYGMRSAHIELADGGRVPLRPAKGSLEHGRARMDRRYPRASRALSIVSFVVLVVSLLLAVPEWISIVLGTFGVEWTLLGLPGQVTSFLSILAVAAGIERALRLRADSFGG